MKYALTKNSTIAVKPSKMVKIFEHSECKGEMKPITKGEAKGQYLCLNCYKSGFLVKKV